MVYDPSGGWPTLAVVAKQLNAAGEIQDTIQLVSETNEILDDEPFFEANETSSHLHTVDASIPEGTWRKLNYGVKPKFGKTAQVRDTIGILEQYSNVDIILARMSRDPAKFRLKEDRRIIEGLNQQLADMLFYGDLDTTPEGYLGLEPRYDVLGQPANKLTANTFNMDHVLDAGGSTASSQSSIWLIGWGENSVFGLYPKGAPGAGIERQDLGQQTLRDADGNGFQGLSTHYRFSQGLGVADWRYIVRIANVEIGALIDEAAINNLVDALTDASNAIPSLGMCRPCYYMNRAVRSRLQKAANRKSNVSLQVSEVYGKRQLNLMDIPFKLCDALLSTEAVVTT